MSAYCRNCGALLGVGNVFCLNCGAPVVASVDDDEPETVVRPSEFERHTVVVPQTVVPTPVQQIDIPKTWFERNAKNLVAVIISLAVLLALGIIFIKVLSDRSVRSDPTQNVNVVVNSNTPLPSPSPSPTPTPAANVVRSGPEQCVLSSGGKMIQAHTNCDLSDCTRDPSTVSLELEDGLPVTKRPGKAVPAGARSAYSWVPVEINGDKLWVSSNKLSCSSIDLPPAQANVRKPANTRPSPSRTPVPSVPPPGATALCKDGTYSFTGFKLAQCALHGGVSRRY